MKPICQAIPNGRSTTCDRPAKGRTIGNMPLCGIHLRQAEAWGDEIRPL